MWEIRRTFSDKTKTADVKWKIEIFKQERKNTADFMIEFKALAIKVDTNKLHCNFLIKEEHIIRYYQDNTRIPTNSSIRNI